MGARFDDLSVLQDEDPVEFQQRKDAVGDDDRGSICECFLQSGQDAMFCSGVNGGKGNGCNLYLYYSCIVI